jgi:eukaryotic-like serine/threonine-protein kinase
MSVTTPHGATSAPDAMPAAATTLALAQALPASPTLEHGVIGPYRIIRKIGQGGMGAVYLAERADGEFEQQVALKTLLPVFADSPTVLSRLLSERQILARLNHPHIAKLLDGGTDARGLPFLVMEYVDGVKIDQYADVCGLDVRERVKLFLKVCDAVASAHDILIVHRDIKPENILVDATGAPKLLDFGIAKVLSDDPVFAGAINTQTGFSPMTQRYAAPEQIRGELITPATDVYALAVVLYELLTGASPYRDQDLAGLKILRAVTEYDPPAPSIRLEHAQREHAQRSSGRTRITPDLDAVLLKALRKDLPGRYRCVLDFSNDLRAVLRGTAVGAHSGSRWYRWQRFGKKHWLAVAAAAGVLGFFALGMLNLEQQLKSAAREREAAAQTTAFLRDLFLRLDANVSDDPRQTTRALIDLGRDKLTHNFAGQAAVRYGLMATLAQVYLNLGDVQAAAPLLQAVQQHASSLSVDEQQRLQLAQAKLLILQGSAAAALPLLNGRLQTPGVAIDRLALLLQAQRALGDKPGARATLAELARADQAQGGGAGQAALALLGAETEAEFSEAAPQSLAGTVQSNAAPCLAQLDRLSVAALALSAPEQLRALQLRARCLALSGHDAGVLRAFNSLIALAKRQHGSNSVIYARSLAASVDSLIDAGELLIADTRNARVRELLRLHGKTDTPDYAFALRRSAAILQQQARLAAARTTVLQADALAKMPRNVANIPALEQRKLAALLLTLGVTQTQSAAASF